MNTQFKKGVLELIVLFSVEKKDMYGYELVQEVSKVVDVNEGTIYPLLKRLTNENYFDTYLLESNEGPPRKYYHITDKGITRSKELAELWNDFSRQVNMFIGGNIYE
ncbi:MAG: PadR family transcriptional regulator [Bacilli bacterium]|nr:PadR family transcriptional regulator [Bacilli bacterium]